MTPVILGDATLYLGSNSVILPKLDKVDACITDPPYGIGESSKKVATRGKAFGSRVDGKNTKGTFVAPVDYGHFDWDDKAPSKEEISACIACAKRAVIFGGNYFELPPTAKWLVWDKLNSGDFADCELAWTNVPGAVRIFRHMWNGMLRDSERGTPRVHPTQKPVAVMGWCIEQAGKADEIQTIIDPYMGSGTTGVAAIQLGRKFIGIERDERYFDIACKRIERAVAQGVLFEPERPAQVQESLL
jgi:DNA modification methylase